MRSAPFTVFVSVPASRALDALDALSACGATALELLDHCSPNEACAALDGVDARGVLACVSAALVARDLAGAPIRVTATELLDWGSTWAVRLRPLWVGRLVVCVDGVAPPDDAAAQHRGVLRLSTAGVFGSGLHATTSLCIERLAELVTPDVDVLDVGTGTGILALCALRLGARSAVGTDSDPRALGVAQENAARNALSGAFTLCADSPDALGRQFNLVLANILASPLLALAPRLVRALGPSGRLVLSGIRAHEAAEVRRAYTWLGLRASGEDARDDWVRLELTTPW